MIRYLLLTICLLLLAPWAMSMTVPDGYKAFEQWLAELTSEKLTAMLKEDPELAQYRRPQTGETLLFFLAQQNRIPLVRMLLDSGADINARSKDGKTPLFWAAGCSASEEAVALLLARGARADARDREEETPLFNAAAVGSVKMVNLLLDAGVDINARTLSQGTALHRAVASGQIATSALLLEHGARVDFADHTGRTPLFLAIQSGEPAIVRALVDTGVDVNKRDNGGKTALHAVCERARGWLYGGDIILLLLVHGADVSAVDDAGQIPLHVACNYACPPEMIKVLLEAPGVQVNALDHRGLTPVFLAIRRGSEKEVIDALIAHGADPTITDDDNCLPSTPAAICMMEDYHRTGEVFRLGWTPLHEAAYSAFFGGDDGLRKLKALLDAGADVNARDKNGRTPLMVGWAGNFRITGRLEPEITSARLLLARGSDVSAVDERGKTFLHLACAEQGIPIDFLHEVLELKGVEINRRDTEGNTPLLLALLYNPSPPLIEDLLAHGADARVVNDSGYTPLHFAPNRVFAERFVKLGADLNLREGTETPLIAAARFNRLDVVQYLIEQGADPREDSSSGNALLGAAHGGDEKMLAYFLEKGLNPNWQDHIGQTALHQAVIWTNPAAIKFLLAHGANPNLQKDYGDTPLHLAARYGYLEEARLLLAAGADPGIKNKDGSTPLDLAKKSEDENSDAIITLLSKPQR